jgi:hypothetical protein
MLDGEDYPTAAVRPEKEIIQWRASKNFRDMSKLEATLTAEAVKNEFESAMKEFEALPPFSAKISRRQGPLLFRYP